MTSPIYNKQALNNFTSGMMDIQLPRNPLASEVILIFNESVRDHYQDVIVTEDCRIKKLALVKKDPDMNYVQQEMDELLEDNIEQLPWLVKLTMTDLPRRPRAEDQILIEGLRYNISYVKPLNRSLDNIVLLTVYPDRCEEDKLQIYKVDILEDGYFDILYGGNPILYSYDRDSLFNKDKRIPFTSRPPIPLREEGQPISIYIFDKESNYSEFKVNL